MPPAAGTFLRWCDRWGIPPGDLRKVQDRHPARYLDQHQAEALVAACGDGTWLGSRDEIAIRFGLLGIRVAEICRLTWSNLLPDGTLAWIGKGRRPRNAHLGPVFAGLLARWQQAYESGLGRPSDLATRSSAAWSPPTSTSWAAVRPGVPRSCPMLSAGFCCTGRRSHVSDMWRLTTFAGPRPSC